MMPWWGWALVGLLAAGDFVSARLVYWQRRRLATQDRLLAAYQDVWCAEQGQECDDPTCSCHPERDGGTDRA